MNGGNSLINKETFYRVDYEIVQKYTASWVISIQDMDKEIFRTDYVCDSYSSFEFCDRLEEIFKYKLKTIGERLNSYLILENSLKKNLVATSIEFKNYLYYHIGFTVASILKTISTETTNYGFYDFGTYENDAIYAIYFELATDNITFDFIGYGDLLRDVLKLSDGMYHFKKTDDIYELIIFKRGLVNVALGEQFYNTVLTQLDQKGFIFPLILGKNKSYEDVVVDLSKTNGIFLFDKSASNLKGMHSVLIANLFYLYDETELSLIVLDGQETDLTKEVSRSPHVVSYHNEVPFFNEILMGIKEEYKQRMKILKSIDVDNWNDLHIELLRKRNRDALRAFPWLIVTFPSFTHTLETLYEQSPLLYEQLLVTLNALLRTGERLGVKFIFSTESSDTLQMPSTIYSNCMTKITFKNALHDLPENTSIMLDDLESSTNFVLDDASTATLMEVAPSTLGTHNDTDKLAYIFRAIGLDLHREMEEDAAYNSPILDEILTNAERNEWNNLMLSKNEPLFRPRNRYSIEEMSQSLLNNTFEDDYDFSIQEEFGEFMDFFYD